MVNIMHYLLLLITEIRKANMVASGAFGMEINAVMEFLDKE